LARIAWAITGAGHLLIESYEVMAELASKPGVELSTFLSKAGVECVKMYGVWEKIGEISRDVYVDMRASAPEVGGLSRGRYNALIVSPATANTVAKVVVGIADTLVTNAVAQAQKGGTPVVWVPTDQTLGSMLTRLPRKGDQSRCQVLHSRDIQYGEEIQITIRRVDTENFERLKRMDGMTVLNHPYEIRDLVKSFLN